MRKFVFTIFIILSTVNIYSQEMQISGGNDFSAGVFNVNNSFWFDSGGYYWFCKENTSSVFFAPGISFTVRVFYDDNPVSRGFVFRDRVVFVTNEKTAGTISINTYSERISETSSISDDELTTIMDFGLGQSYRFKISKRLYFYTDIGVNFTWMDSEDYETGSTLNYLGGGIFADVAFQINFTERLFLELGLNTITNIFSSQNGKIYVPEENINVKYEDTGRWDLMSMAFYIQIGLRFDLKKTRGEPLQE